MVRDSMCDLDGEGSEVSLGKRKVSLVRENDELLHVHEEYTTKKIKYMEDEVKQDGLVDVKVGSLECINVPFSLGLTTTNRYANRQQ